MAALIKQAKEILDGKDKFSKITDLIKDGELAKAIEMYDNIEPLEKPAFTQSKSFKSLTLDQQQAFNQAIVTNQAAQEKAEELAGDTEENKKDTKTTDNTKPEEIDSETVVSDTQEDAGSNVDITDILGDAPKSDEQSETQSTENQGSADLNSVPKEGSIFEYLHKAAAEVDEVSLEKQAIDKDTAQAVKDAVNSYIDQGLSAQEAKRKALEDLGVTGDVYYEKIADDVIATKSKAATIEDHTLNVESLLNDVAAYKPEASLDEQIVELSKSSATAYEFLNKVAELSRQANKLDEVSGKQYPGQKQYDGKMVTQAGGFGLSPQHPGQKVLATRAGGNSAVESNFPKSAKPETDVFNKKSDKAGITSINSLDGTIAFMQPLPFEKNEMGTPADYTGYVTGTMAGKKGDPNAAGPVAEAGHVTSNYLDEVYKAADKKASLVVGLDKKAGSYNSSDEYYKNVGPEHKKSDKWFNQKYKDEYNSDIESLKQAFLSKDTKKLKQLLSTFKEYSKPGYANAYVREKYEKLYSFLKDLVKGDTVLSEIPAFDAKNKERSLELNQQEQEEFDKHQAQREAEKAVRYWKEDDLTEILDNKGDLLDISILLSIAKYSGAQKCYEVIKNYLQNKQGHKDAEHSEHEENEVDTVNLQPDPVAEAGHVTSNYLDEASDKKKVAGYLPGAKASTTAGFVFHGFSKTAGVTKTATPDKPLPRTFGYEPIFKSDKLNVEVHVDDRTADYIGQSVGGYAFLLSGTHDLIAAQHIVANDDGYTLGEMHFHDQRSGKTLPQVSENNETVYEKFGIDENTWADAMNAVQNDFNKRMTEADVQPHVPGVSVEVDPTNPNLERDNPLQNPEHKESAENADLKKKASDTVNDITSIGGSGVSSDASFDSNPSNKNKQKTLTTDEASEARKKITEQEAGIQRANSLDDCLRTIASSLEKVAAMVSFSEEYDTVMSMLDELKTQTPPAYDAVLKAANQDDLKTFTNVVKQALITNMKSARPDIDEILIKTPFDKIQNSLKHQTPQEPASGEEKEEPKDKNNQKTEKKEEKEDKPKASEKPTGDAGGGGDPLSDLLNL